MGILQVFEAHWEAIREHRWCSLAVIDTMVCVERTPSAGGKGRGLLSSNGDPLCLARCIVVVNEGITWGSGLCSLVHVPAHFSALIPFQWRGDWFKGELWAFSPIGSQHWLFLSLLRYDDVFHTVYCLLVELSMKPWYISRSNRNQLQCSNSNVVCSRHIKQ
jgi:hypothetical protein